jgi:hypothetical protein
MRNFIILAVVAFSTRVLGGPHDSLTTKTLVSLTGTNTIVRTNSAAITGKVLSMTLGSTGGSCTARVYTVSDNGSSWGTTKILLPAIVVPPAGIVTNFAAVQYLAEDLVVVRFDNAATTAAVDCAATLIFER